LFITVGVLVSPAVAPEPAAAQGLSITLTEDPFVCDGFLREFGSIWGFIPGEGMQFRSPQLGGVFSSRIADANGTVLMRWQCRAPEQVTVTAVGLLSGNQVTFVLRGVEPPQAPQGSGFDTASAMTVAEMATWADFSPYESVGVYIPVNSAWDNRADKQQVNLNASWIATVRADGWSVMPIYVGRQAPAACAAGSFFNISVEPTIARIEGFQAGADAIASMASFGLGPGSVIYYDLEGYRPGCEGAIKAFVDAWTEQLHTNGYVSGVYGSRISTISDLETWFGSPGFDAPDAVWVATGNTLPVITGLGTPPDHLWPSARIHQFRLDINRTYAGVSRNIDENIVAGPVIPATTRGNVVPTPTAVPTPSAMPTPNPQTCAGHVITVVVAPGVAFTGSEGREVIMGTPGDDVIFGGGGDDVICGLGGNDFLAGNGGDDILHGDAGDDVIQGSNGDDLIFGGAGKDQVRGQNGNDVINGGAGNDSLNGNNGADTVNGGDGHDYVSGRGGEDIVTGGPGADTVLGGGRKDVVRGGPGNDTLSGNGFADQIFGGAGNDSILGGDGPDHLRGEMGNDVLDGGRGNDTLWGGNGADSCNGRTGWDRHINCESLINIP